MAPMHRAIPRLLLLLLLVLPALAWGASLPKEPKPPTPPPDEAGYGGKTLAELDALLQDPDPKQRVAALVALREAGTAAVPVLLWALDDEDASVRSAAIRTLGPLGPASEAAIPALTQLLLNDPMPAVRTQIIHTLGQMGPYALDAVPALRRLQRAADITTRVNAAQAIDRILASQRP